MGVFSGTGRYVVNIDSDGRLDRFAIANIVRRFEDNTGIVAMSGVVLTDVEQITQLDNLPANPMKVQDRILKLVHQCELFEYCESFLVGRSFQSIFNNLNTMAGAFSCFRRESLLKTQLYNTETMGEDAHMTSQVKMFSGGRVVLCENAFYFTQALENLDKLYTQRQRWQRAELEVAGLFKESYLGGMVGFFRKPAMRRLVSSHTLAFPRLIWLFAMLYLYFINYPLELLAGANTLLYVSYIMLSFLNISVACLYLGNQRMVRTYLRRHMHICLILPLYRFILYWIRLAGIINSLTTPSKWRTRTLTEEIGGARREAGKVVHKRFGFMYKLKHFINGGEKER
jgi:putative glycosyltransferase (exosortase G-associated)